MSETSSPSVPEQIKQKTISSEKEKKNNAILILTIIECVLLGVLSIVCFFAVKSLTTYDSYYRIYYFFPITGFIMLGIMIVAYFRKWLALQLLSVIIVLFWVTYCGATIYSCLIAGKVYKLEEPYRNSEMYVVFNGKRYEWEGKTVIYGLPAEWEDLQKRAVIKERDDSKKPTEELHAKGIDAGSMIFYQDGYKYILVECVTGSLFEFIDPNDPPEDTISTDVTTLGIG